MKKLIIILSLSMSSILLSGQIINIPADFESIQLGINAASSGDTILVDTGIYSENINFSGKNIKLVSRFIIAMDTNLIHQTIIDGDSLGSVISVVNGEDSAAQLMGFTIRNGLDTLGGGVKIINSSLKISNCIITENIAYKEGGGIYCFNSVPYISFSSISHNKIFKEDNGNSYGAGVCLLNSGGAITNSEIIYNSLLSGSFFEGGGIYYHNSNTLLENLVISNNFAHVGGGICTYLFTGYSTTFKNLKVYNNHAILGGGITTGVPNNNTSIIAIVNSLFENNYVGGGGQGGGAFCLGDKTIFTNCSFVNNTGGKGGLYVSIDTEVHLFNTIISNNSPSELYIQYHEPGQSSGKSYLSYCNLYPNGVSGEVSSLYYIEGNINAEPWFVNNGDFPYMLNDESPCVNTGIPDTTGLLLPEIDLANNTRFFGGRIDMGAYENQNVWIGISESSDIQLSIEPNPFHNETFIRFNSNNKRISTIDLYDINGRKIRNLYKGLTISKNDKFPINTFGLDKGTYIISIRTTKSIISKKILKE